MAVGWPSNFGVDRQCFLEMGSSYLTHTSGNGEGNDLVIPAYLYDFRVIGAETWSAQRHILVEHCLISPLIEQADHPLRQKPLRRGSQKSTRIVDCPLKATP